MCRGCTNRATPACSVSWTQGRGGDSTGASSVDGLSFRRTGWLLGVSAMVQSRLPSTTQTAMVAANWPGDLSHECPPSHLRASERATGSKRHGTRAIGVVGGRVSALIACRRALSVGVLCPRSGPPDKAQRHAPRAQAPTRGAARAVEPHRVRAYSQPASSPVVVRTAEPSSQWRPRAQSQTRSTAGREVVRDRRFFFIGACDAGKSRPGILLPSPSGSFRPRRYAHR